MNVDQLIQSFCFGLGVPVSSIIHPSLTALLNTDITPKLHGHCNEQFSPLQEAFLEENAMQCGYCTSGMILSAVALLEGNPEPTDSAIITALNGNLCRCNGYPRVLDAVRSAARKMRS